MAPSQRAIRLALLIAALGGCDQTVEPFADADADYSIVGHLDASADTQWVRVMPLRQTIFTSSAPHDVIVSLEHMGTGRSVILQDSIFRFRPSYLEAGEEIYVHNYWTTERIHPSSEYRLRVTRADGRSSEATVQIPPDFPVQVLYFPNSAPGDLAATVRVEVENLAMVQLRRHIDPACPDWQLVPHYGATSFSLPTPASRVYDVRVSRAGRFASPCRVTREDLFVVSSGVPWRFGSAFSSGALTSLDAPSNISDAVGFFAGVLTRAVPWESCSWSSSALCPLVYNSSSASLSGRILDIDCGGIPLDAAEVRLTEVPSAGIPIGKVRAIRTAADGTFRIDALDPGARYAVRVTHRDVLFGGIPPLSAYLELTGDTLRFAAAEHKSYEAGLKARFPDSCGTWDIDV